MKNTILLQRLLINFPPNGVGTNLAETMSVQSQLMKYGFMLSEEGFEMLSKSDTADIKQYMEDCISYLKSMVGEDKFQSLYQDFPRDVMSMSESEKRFKQLLHYWNSNIDVTVGATLEPEDNFFEDITYKIIKPCTEQEYKAIFTNLLSVGNSLTPQDTKTISWFVQNETGLTYPDKIPFKENLAVITKLCPDFTVQTVIDCLRVAVGFSGGDVSLPAVPKKLKKKGRKFAERELERAKFKFKLSSEEKLRVLSLLEESNLNISDMQQGSKYGRFIRLAEILQPERNSEKFPKTARVFHRLRNQVRKGKPGGEAKVITWYSQCETAKKQGLKEYLLKLSERPGEFLRKLDYLIRTYSQLTDILAVLSKVAKGSSNKVIFEVMEHFDNRTKDIERSVFVKGARSKTVLPKLIKLPEDVVSTIKETLWQVIQDKFSELPALKNCYIDEGLKRIPLPTNMRSLSESLVVTVRGQRMPLDPNAAIIRPYVQWTDTYGNVDLDLSATFLGDGTKKEILYYGRQNLGTSVHSGDVRNRQGNCAEYVDIDLVNALGQGFKYVIVDVRDYNNDIGGLASKNSIFGFMFRQFPDINPLWLPETVVNAFKLNSSAKGTIVCCIDLVAKEWILIDQDSDSNTATNTKDMLTQIESWTKLPNISVYDLVSMHVVARGGMISSKDAADEFFLFEKFSTSYLETMKLMGI